MIMDHAPSSPLENAVMWVGQVMLGSIATGIAVIAVAAVGLLMLNGRIDRRRAALTLIGCFVIFGARSIANGIVGGSKATALSIAFSLPPAPISPPSPSAETYDPYAGAAPALRPSNKNALRDGSVALPR